MNVTDTHGSSIEKMAEVVENSYCVILCATEKYRQSLNCQAEAIYSFKLNKPIIPLLTEPCFNNSHGWLGMVISVRPVIDFTMIKYEDCITRLVSEINSYLPRNTTTTTTTTTVTMTGDDSSQKLNTLAIKVKETSLLSIQPPPVINPNSLTTTSKSSSNANNNNNNNIVENWSENQVFEWFETNKIDRLIMELLLPCEGGILRQLYGLRRDAPEFYFQSLSQNRNVELKSILAFSRSLEKLFNT